MGTTNERIEISVTMSNQFSAQDNLDLQSLEELQWKLRKAISEVQAENPHIVITTVGL